MGFTLPPDTFPPLQLSTEEAESITQTTQRLVDESISEFNDMIANNRQLPKKLWKFVTARQNLRVYRTRSSSNYASDVGSSTAWTPQVPHLLSASMYQEQERTRARKASALHSSPETGDESDYASSSSASDAALFAERLDSEAFLGSMLEADKPPHTPTVLVTGFYAGTIEDAALGNLADTEALWKLRSSYIHDERDDYKILATLLRPSKRDPFRFLGIKWSSKKFAALTSQRDLVYVESAGVLRDPGSGALTMGYNLLHSVEIARVPELRQFGIIRIKLSICFLTRQHDANTVELYCRGYSAPGGDMIASVATAVYAESMLLSVNVMECAYAKKLMWLIKQRRSTEHSTVRASLATATHCAACTKSFRGLNGLLRSPRVCQCCRRVVCRQKCSVTVKLPVDISASEVTHHKMPFCLQCLLQARQLSALVIATATAPDAVARSSRSFVAGGGNAAAASATSQYMLL